MVTGRLSRLNKHQPFAANAFIQGDAGGSGAANGTPRETTPPGSGGVLEEQMMKVAANQMEYRTAASPYSKPVAPLGIAAGSQ